MSCFRLRQNDDKKPSWKITVRIFFIVIKLISASLPGGSVKWQYRTWGSGGSFWTSSVLLTLCRRVGIKGQTPRGAAPCRGVPAMCEIRQAGGAGVLGAVACRRRRWPQGGDRAVIFFAKSLLRNSSLSKSSLFYLKSCFAGWHSWNCENVRTGSPLQDQAGLLQSLQEDL